MSKYRYKAKDAKGMVVDSSVDAHSRNEAIDKICQMGYYPLSVEESVHNVHKDAAGILSVRPSFKVVTDFAVQLANISKSGIPLISGIKIISEQADNARFRNALENVYNRIKDGLSLSGALEVYPELFDPFFVSMVKVGEDNGNLPEVLLKISEYRKRQTQVRTKIKNALAYPIFLSLVGCFSVVFILTNVMPKLTVLIKNMGMQLPLITRVLIDLTSFMQGNFLWVSLALLAFYMGFFLLSRNPASRYTFDAVKLHVPLLGKLTLESEIVRFSQTLGVSLKNGLHVLKSLELAVSVLGNEVIKTRLSGCREEVKNGLSLGVCIKKTGLFPASVSGMISIGEESGRLTVILEQIGEEYEARVDDTIRVIMTLIEPAIILVLGAIVGFIVMALLLPVFQMDILVK